MNKEAILHDNQLAFRPVIGKEALILSQTPDPGHVWFATDSKKIYYSDGVTHLPMGGNSSVFYGIKDFGDEAVDGQTEFQFGVFDIDGNEDAEGSNYKIPNVDDLILNSDGCFYRVAELEGEGEDIIIHTLKLTIAGGGGGGVDVNVGKLTLERVTEKNVTCLFKEPFKIYFNVSAVDASGAVTGDGTYRVEINGQKDKIKGVCKQGANSIELGSYLSLGVNKIRVYVSMDVGGADYVTQSMPWEITTTQINLVWDYNESEVNNLNNDLTLSVEVSGYQIEKKVYAVIDNYIEIPAINFTATSAQPYTFNPKSYGLNHGAHKLELRATAIVNEKEISIPSITKNIILEEPTSNVPIISCSFFDETVVQYNTVKIPIIFYQKSNTAGNLTAELKENGTTVDNWSNIVNGEVRDWNYTPVETTTRNLTISCGGIEKTLILEVEALDIDNEEVGGYAFRFKASDFASNTAVQGWNSNGVTATFSDNFDWINGGIKDEKDENGNTRQYLCVRAGSTMTINYELFSRNAPYAGKAFKFIFKATGCRDYDAQVLDCFDDTQNIGIRMNAQETTLRGSANSLTIPYCEDSYIEFEFDISKTHAVKRYMTPWLDGVPVAIKQYGSNEQFMHNKKIVIGSQDCDVYVYLIKVYETHLSDESHLQNFIADAPNAREMLDRYNRNDIIDKERGVISPTLLAEKNPNCRVHVYDISRMTLNKKDKIKGCKYKQYHGSDTPVLSAENVTIKVQGTSSAAYGLAAFNLDSEFESGFVYPDGSTSEGWAMNENSIPVNYFCTKVNVASAEHCNNAMNQEWYNRYQPYTTALRKKNPKARDTMEFTPGVLFIQDHNTQKDFETSDKFISNNVFAEIEGYTSNPYDRMYSICNMGNSKKNIEVLHDISNPIEYCVEVADNQKPMQWMTQCDYTDDAWDSVEPDWEFRYPDGHKELDNAAATFTSPLTGNAVTHRQHAFDAWRRFITWMAKTNPQPAYEEIKFNSQEELTAYIENVSEESAELTALIAELNAAIETFEELIAELEEKVEDETITEAEEELLGEYEDALEEKQVALLEAQEALKATSAVYAGTKDANGLLEVAPEVSNGTYDSALTYFIKTSNTYGYTNVKLPAAKTYGTYTFGEPSEPGIVSNPDYITHLKGTSVTTYNGTYTHDTFEYRMAKMLHECENYLVMDSVLYHALFIERHTMIDNVSKNTFWSTEDGLHWNLTKDYDNDTSDGNDNQGKLTLTYGIEPLDNVPGSTTDFYFNANQSVWFRFSANLYQARRALYNSLESTGENGQENAWDATAYLKACSDWQKTIPERCWIEDYYRKYIRPLEIYGDSMFVDMLEGGQKTHQRKQYETYQNYYMSSRYIGKAATDNKIIIRGNGNEYQDGLPASVYADCYIQAAFGSGQEPNVSMRVKRNQPITIDVPSSLGTMDNATIYFFLPQLYQTIGELDNGSLNILLPEQITVSPAVKLRTLIAGQYGEQNAAGGLLENTSLEEIGFNNNVMLEHLHMCNYPGTTLTLDLKKAVNLKTLDLRNSGFTDISIADGAPITSIKLDGPGTLQLSNLRDLETLSFEKPQNLRTLLLDNIDTSDINSKTHILDLASGLTHYRLKNIQWDLTTASELDLVNKKINILETLLTKTPYSDQGQAVASTHADNLSGIVEISSEVNVAVAKEIYERYSISTAADTVIYPNVDLQFTNTVSTVDGNKVSTPLYTVTVLNGGNKTVWSRKFPSGYSMTADDLKASPYGAFSKDALTKPSNELYDYEFSGSWKVYNSTTGAELTSITGETPLLTDISCDTTLEPQFTNKPRIWKVTIYNGNTQLYSGDCVAGTNLKTFIDNNYPDIPYKNDSGLALAETYGFIGYALSKSSSSGIDLSRYSVTTDMTLYAIFKAMSVYENIHEDYFTYAWDTYNEYDDENDTGFYVMDGYVATLKSDLNLKGKITIPATHTDPATGVAKPVWGVGGFNPHGDSQANTVITHVFVGRENLDDDTSTNLRVVKGGAFRNCTALEYFDFPSTSLRQIEDQAFRRTPLKPNYTSTSYYFGDNLYKIGTQAFNQSLDFNGKTNVDLIFSNALTILGSGAFSYIMGDDEPNVLNIYIGNNSGDLSQLNVAIGCTNASEYPCFNFNDNIIGDLLFYTKQYQPTWDQKVGGYDLAEWLGSADRITSKTWEITNGRENDTL